MELEKSTRKTKQKMPSLNDRLGQLRPSRELLEFYRKKLLEYDCEHDSMVERLEKYKMTYEEQHKIEWEMKQREEEITELQKALSDMQTYLFQEREHVLRLYAENDRLKIREIEDRKKIHLLLSLSGLTEREVSYFLKEPPSAAVIQQKLPQKLRQELERLHLDEKIYPKQGSKKFSSKDPKKKQTNGIYERDNESLALQVEALQAQLAEQTKLAKEQMEALLEDRRVRQEESDTRASRDQEKLRQMQEKLNKAQDLLYDSTKQFLQQRADSRAQELAAVKEKDLLLRQLDDAKCKLERTITFNPHQDIDTNSFDSTDNKLHAEEEITILRDDCEKAQELAEMYREQVIQLEEELSKIREEGDVGKELFKERAEKMAKRLDLMNQRYQELEKRRILEVEGFKTDIKNLREKIKSLEKQLFRITIGVGDDLAELSKLKKPDEIDMAMLRRIHSSAQRSKYMVGELKNLKSKVYGMEADLRRM
ncbi:DgyrCDS5800 [Dimorphilus gyrociliatus]|uniref:DgyrCDS5800 n=1 Tax=Dimorphilus gyrociliatus TaxID=2664684 RepID=A0A7I8VL41_9ANNE|nr:DgyrCDS5800 [Dimorphilus gyrociliatus]